jgi:hypothetical protein
MMLTVYAKAQTDAKGRLVVARGESAIGRETVVYRGNGLFRIALRINGRHHSTQTKRNWFDALKYAKDML